jgi:hypothetical protein
VYEKDVEKARAEKRKLSKTRKNIRKNQILAMG